VLSKTVEETDATRELLVRWHRQHDVAAREELVARMLPLAHSLARRYQNKGEPLDDLEQVASVGLLKAIDRFDVSREVKFATFAVPTIAGEIKRHFRDRGWMLRVPREVQELTAKLTRAREALSVRLCRSPNLAELAQATDSTVAQVAEALVAGDAYRMMSLDEPVGEGGGTLEAIGGDDHNFELTEHRMLIKRGLDGLEPREREILRLRFYEGLTQREIADEVGISQMHVSRLIRRSVDTMREAIEPPVAVAAAA
jgi:RNA polymerase sigma-B factor